MPLTDFPNRFEQTKSLLLADGTRLQLESARIHKDVVLVKFHGMDSPEKWIPLRHQELYVTEDDLMPLAPGQYYIHQIVGLTVLDETGTEQGIVADVLQTGSNDVYVVKTKEGGELLLPAIDSVVRRIDMNQAQMIVTIPEYY